MEVLAGSQPLRTAAGNATPQAAQALPPPRAERGSLLAALLLAAAYLVLLLSHFAPAISTPDANGYFAQARHIAERGQTWFKPESVLQFIPPHWVAGEDGRYFCKYPPGLPLLAAGVRRVWGAEASLLVNPVMAALTLLGVYAIGRRWANGWCGFVAALATAMMPAINQQALFAFAHTAVAFLLVWGIYFAVRWESDGRAIWLLLAGLAFGAIPSVRYPEALFVLAFGLFVVLLLRRSRSAFASLSAAGVGCGVPIGALLVRNQLAFGAAWRTGYAASNEQTGFGWSYFVEHAVPYLQSLQGDGAGLFVALGLVGMAIFLVRPETRARGVLLLGLVAPITILYMAYYWGQGDGAMRFFVPVFFVFAIAAAPLLQLVSRAGRGTGLAACTAILLYTFAWGAFDSLRNMDHLRRSDAALARATSEVRKVVEPGSLVLADRDLAQQLDFVGGWRLVDEMMIRGGRMGRPGNPGALFPPDGPGGPDELDDLAQPAAMRDPGPLREGDGRPADRRNAGPASRREARPPDEEDFSSRPDPMIGQGLEARMERFADLPPERRRQAITDELIAWANGRSVYWIGEKDELPSVAAERRRLGRLTTIATFELPANEMPEGPMRLRPGPGQPGFGGRGAGPPGFGPGGMRVPPGGRDRGPGGPPGMRGGPGPGGPGGGAWTRGGTFVIARWELATE